MTRTHDKRHVAVVGPTASGKSDLAMKLAEHWGGEIVSCDSVQVYQGFDIGSAKPTLVERGQIKHHLIDVVGFSQNYDAADYAQDAGAILDQLAADKRAGIVTGGTGLYLRALWGEKWDNLPSDTALRQSLEQYTNEQLLARLRELDLRRSTEIHLNDRYRLTRAVEVALLLAQGHGGSPQPAGKGAIRTRREDFYVILMAPDRATLLRRIEERTHKMLAQGLIDEVKALLQQGCPVDVKPMQSIGYKQVAAYLRGELARKELAEAIIIATRQYAKRQKTWFSKVPCDLVLSEPSLRLVKDHLADL
jgi:tRNA dimethylallyltransferase